MKLIDADALLNKTIYNPLHAPYIVEKDIREMPTAQPEPQWIPCSERMPTRKDHTDDMVLVCYGNGSVRFNTCMDGEWVQGNPIAWMPLPEAYKEGGEKI